MRDVGFTMIATITAQYSPSGYGGEQLGTFKTVLQAKRFISKVIAEEELDSFIQGYITCALWSSTYERLNEDTEEFETASLDDDYSEDDLSTEAMQTIKEDCKDFVKANKALLKRYYKAYKPSQQYDVIECAGHDFWLTRNGHGAGFWDRGLGKLGEQLADSARVYGSVDLYVGDDGKIYC